jgi:hypothetical protein
VIDIERMLREQVERDRTVIAEMSRVVNRLDTENARLEAIRREQLTLLQTCVDVLRSVLPVDAPAQLRESLDCIERTVQEQEADRRQCTVDILEDVNGRTAH